MKQERFLELANKFDTFYLMYTRTDPAAKGKGRAFMVATTNLNTPYIQAQLANASTYVKTMLGNDNVEQTVVFSYSTNSFKVIPYQSITRLSCLSVELDKQERSNARSRRF